MKPNRTVFVGFLVVGAGAILLVVALRNGPSRTTESAVTAALISTSSPAAVSNLGRNATRLPVATNQSNISGLSDLSYQLAGVTNLDIARVRSARFLLQSIKAASVTTRDLQTRLLDPSESVVAKIIYAEAILGLLKNDIALLDTAAISQLLLTTDSPVLASRLIDILGIAKDPRALDAIVAKANTKAENVRLAAVQAARQMQTPTSLAFLRSQSRDGDFYRVRIQAIHGLAEHPQSVNPAAEIVNVVKAERAVAPESVPTGQSGELNKQLIAMAAAQILTGRQEPEAITFLIQELCNAQNPMTVRKAAADALGAIQTVETSQALLAALNDPNEGVRIHAARSLKKAFGTKYQSEIAVVRDASTDSYVIDQINQLLKP